jgi:hypothetical protein
MQVLGRKSRIVISVCVFIQQIFCLKKPHTVASKNCEKIVFMHRSVPLCTLQFAVEFLISSGWGGGEGGESVGEKRGGRVGGEE